MNYFDSINYLKMKNTLAGPITKLSISKLMACFKIITSSQATSLKIAVIAKIK